MDEGGCLRTQCRFDHGLVCRTGFCRMLETLYLIFSILVVGDVITGIIKAWKNGRLKSRTLRDGLFASLGELILLLLCIGAAELVPLTILIVFSILIFMVIKELCSILENLLEIGARVPSWLVKGLKIYVDKFDNLEMEDK